MNRNFGSVRFGSGFGRFLEFRFGFVDFFVDRIRIFLYIKSTVIRDFRLSDSDTCNRHLIKRETVYTVKCTVLL